MSEQALDAHLEQWEQRPEEMIETEKGYLEWLEERIAQLEERLASARCVANDGWDWVDDVCALLGCNVFEIKDKVAQLETENERLRNDLAYVRAWANLG